MFKLIAIACILAIASAAPAPGGVYVAAPLLHSASVVHTPALIAHHPVSVSHSSSHVVHSAPKLIATPVVHANVYHPIAHHSVVHTSPVLTHHSAPLYAIHH